MSYDRFVIGEEQTGRIFQIGGLVAWAMVGVETFLQFAHGIDRGLVPKIVAAVPAELAPRAMGLSITLLWVAALLMFLAFGLAFRSTTAAVLPSPRRRLMLLLAAQVVLALALSSDLLYLAAAEIPFVLHGRRALAWFGGQSLLTAVGAFTSEPIALLSGAALLARPVALSLTVLSALAWQGLAFAAGTIAVSESRRRRELAQLIAELVATQQVLAQSARAAERTRIARDLHDAIGHHLAALSVNLELASHLAEPPAAPAIAAAQETARALLAEVRSVVGATRGETDVELRQALVLLASGVELPRVHLALPSGPVVLAQPTAHALFRAVQEAITNAVRHAAARNLWLEVRFEDGGITLTARDDGRGATAIVPGNGLRGMRERIEALGGRLTIEARPGAGLALLAWVPVGGAAP
ncbi:MAG TPA: histidine kinase [Thermoanaerobaculaceae bacterium]|nr:histidine kinase [Thermoanaerobaculaceae bacterium]